MDASTGKVLATYVPTIFSQGGSGGGGYLTPVASVWSTNGTQIISLFSGLPHHWTIQTWSASTGKLVNTPLTQNGDLEFMSLSPHGTHVAISTGKDIEIWNIAANTLASHLPVSIDSQHEPSALAWSPDESRLALGTADASHVNIWSVSDGQQTASFADKNVGYLAWSPDGKYLAESSTMIHLWDVHAKKVVATFGDNQWVASLAWSADGSKLASAASKQGDFTKNTVSIWKLS